MQEALYVLIGLGIVGLLEGGYHLLAFLRGRKSEELRRRLQTLGQGREQGRSLLREGRLSTVPWLDDLLRGLPVTARLEGLLIQSNVEMRVDRLLAICAACGFAVVLVGSAIGVGLLPTLLMAAVLTVSPILFMVVVRDRRSSRISEQLPDALDMMSRSLKAGHAIPSALQFVASEMPEPINVEFGRAYEEQRLGRTLEQSIVGITERVPANRDLKIFAVSVIVQRETGGNLTEILENIASTIRARYRFYSKLRALTAEGRVSGIILGMLPIAMLLFMLVANRKYLSTLFNTPMGNSLAALALVLWIVGLIWLFRMTKVEF